MTNISLFQIIQFILIAVILLYLLYYVYTLLFDKNYQPRAWKLALKEGSVSSELKKAEQKYADKVRFFNFWFQIERLKKEQVPGVFAELGVYKGDSAYFIHLMDSSRDFHLFDTFEGFTEKDLEMEHGKAATYTKHNFADTSIERVKQRLSQPQFIFHKGYFPDTATKIQNEQFAMVSMDVDLYKPTKAGLEFFYPRLARGGVLIIHDYNPDWPGIVKAVDEFAMTIPEPIIPLADVDNTVMIFKVGKD
jgi:O-methyltransferase